MTFQFCIISKNILVAEEPPLAQWLPDHLCYFVSISGAFPEMALGFFNRKIVFIYFFVIMEAI